MSEIYGTTSVYERQLDHIRKLQAPQPDPLQESLSAIRDAITSRDRHFDALAEQLRLLHWRLDQMASWQEAIQHRQGTIGDRFEAALKALGAQLEGIEQTQIANVHKNLRLKAGAGRKKAKR